MAKHVQCFQRITFPEDFQQTFEQFKAMIETDKTIRATVKPEDLRRGLVSPAIRFLIRRYVDHGWPGFVAKQKEKLAEKNSRGETNAAA